jgi:hypothetical protein
MHTGETVSNEEIKIGPITLKYSAGFTRPHSGQEVGPYWYSDDTHYVSGATPEECAVRLYKLSLRHIAELMGRVDLIQDWLAARERETPFQ